MAITTNNGQNVSYQYRADGTKIKKVVGSKTIDYLDGFVYETVSSTTTLQFYPNAEGYYDFKNAKYIYNYKDHLGNVRLSYTKNSSGAAVVLEENNYYPFGLKHDGYNTGNTGNPSYTHKYNGKELQENGMYDYGWRNYQPELGRWFGIDQLAEKYHSFSPYAYVVNNPIMMIDPDGRYTSQIQSLKDSMPNIYSGWEYVEGINFGDWHNFASGAQFSAFVQYVAANGGGGGGFGGGSGVGSGAASGSFGYNGGNFGSGNDGLNTIDIPEVIVRGKGWGQQLQDHFNAFMHDWNSKYGNDKYGWDYAADRLWNTAKLAANSTDFVHSGMAAASYSKYGWLDAKGNYHRMSELAKQANGKFLRGVQGKRISAATAKAFSGSLGKIAKKAGFAGYVLDGAEAVYDGKITAGEVSKMTINVVSAYAGPVGWIWMGADIGVAFFNDGKGLNDMIAEEIDNSLGNNATLIKF